MKTKLISGLSVNQVLIALFALFLFGFQSTLAGLLTRWTQFDEAYGHGLLIVGICLYFAYDARARIARANVRPMPLAAIAAAAASLLWLIAFMGSISIIQELLLPVILLCAIAAVAGPDVARPLLFPILMGYFAIPIWDYLNNTLVDLTVVVVRNLLPLWHISALVEGNAIQIPDGTVVIADGCSGLRYVVSGTALATIAAKLNFSTLRARAAMVIGGIALSLLANWVRVLSLVLIGHYTQMQSPLMHEHDHYGWLLFIGFISPIFLLSWFAGSHGKQSASTAGKPKVGENSISPVRTTIAAIAMLIGPLATLQLSWRQADEFNLQAPAPRGWHATDLADDGWAPTMPPAYRSLSKSYQSGQDTLNAFIYAYRKDGRQQKLLPYIDSVYDKDRWRLLDSEIIQKKTGRGVLDINRLTLKSASAESRRTVWYWFDVGGRATASYSKAKLNQIPAQFGGQNHAVVVVIEAPCQYGGCADNALLENLLGAADFDSDTLIERRNDGLARGQ